MFFLFPLIFLCNSGMVLVVVIIPVLLMAFGFSTFMHIYNLTLLKELGYEIATFHRWGNWGWEKPSNQTKVTQKINGEAWTRACFVQLPIQNWLHYTPGPWRGDLSGQCSFLEPRWGMWAAISCCKTLVSSWQLILREDLILGGRALWSAGFPARTFQVYSHQHTLGSLQFSQGLMIFVPKIVRYLFLKRS